MYFARTARHLRAYDDYLRNVLEAHNIYFLTIVSINYADTKRTVLSRYLKILLDTDPKIILDHQNNYVGCSNWLLKR